ncbi:MAG: hypothetical protein PUB12_08300 [[Clostridium] aminophilum]|nr:hypothetical protein [[Clostridium] aminophilum]MDD6196867.1 hypothetical protein [[Clostridium] aminophilum]
MASELHYTITATTKAGIIEQILAQQEAGTSAEADQADSQEP